MASVLRELLGDCQTTREPASPGGATQKDTLQIDGLVITRPGVDFTPYETARAAALITLGTRLAPRRRPAELGP